MATRSSKEVKYLARVVGFESSSYAALSVKIFLASKIIANNVTSTVLT
jgi:hypothetical protein